MTEGRASTTGQGRERMTRRGLLALAGTSVLAGCNGLAGLGGGDDKREQLAAAEELAQMYADDLQAKLETQGKWEQVRTAASEE